MELYAYLKKGMGEIIVVTYDGERKRVARRIYVEEGVNGHIQLVVKGADGVPEKLGDELFWIE